jgi:hypothetical protein
MPSAGAWDSFTAYQGPRSAGKLSFCRSGGFEGLCPRSPSFQQETYPGRIYGTGDGPSRQKMGVRFVERIYADRVYNPDGTLQSRKISGSVIHDLEKAAQQALAMVQNGYVLAHDGIKVNVKPESICVHGDTPTAVAILQKIGRA